jgi:apolipoprotein N-acyltransferase
LRNPEFFTDLSRDLGVSILAATHVPVTPGRPLEEGRFDAAILYGIEGKVLGYHRATQTPPLRRIAEKTGGDYNLLEMPFGKLGILLCYEDNISGVAASAVRKGAELLVALSNPGHFRGTHLPFYHLVQDRLRALENGRWLVRVSPNGYTAVIDPFGRFAERSELDRRVVIQAKAGITRGMTFYHRNGKAMPFAAMILLALLMVVARRRGEKLN